MIEETKNLLNLLSKRQVPPTPILMDGAMGTMIHAAGEGFEGCFDVLNVSKPGLIAQIHRAYIDAGAEILLTNTFGANRFRLSRHGLETQVREINTAGVELAHRVISASFKEVLVAGDVGPLGVRLVPFGRVSLENARSVFVEQIEALDECQIDLLVLETFSDIYEITQALRAARDVLGDGNPTPVAASMTFTDDDTTLFGNPPEEVVETLLEEGADLVGINCSGGPVQILRILHQMRRTAPEASFFVKPNAGLPAQAGGRIMYPAGPSYFGEYAQAFRRSGAALIGGCCGTTPAHIAAMRVALNSPPRDYPELADDSEVIKANGETFRIQKPTTLSQKLASREFIATVEMAPPRGIAIEKVLTAASMLGEAGADAINVADSPMARMRMSPWALASRIQTDLGLETILHFPTRGRNLLRVQGDLLAAHALDVRNVFVVMGDPTAIGDYPDAMDDYDLVPSGLLKLVSQCFNAGTDYAGSPIGQPTSFFTGCALNLTPEDPERESRVLERKVRNGAEFALTQPVFDAISAQTLVEKMQSHPNLDHLPLIVGILPLYNARHAAFLHHEVPGIYIPKPIRDRFETTSDPVRLGLEVALELIELIRPWASGVYLMPPFKRYDLAAEIIEMIK